jgi:hypothetical protein
MSVTQRNTKKRFKIRSDRYAMPDGLGSLEIKGKTFEVLNYSATGIALVLLPGDKSFTKDEEFESDFLIDGFRIASLRLRFLYQVPLEDRDNERAAFEIVGPLLDSEQVMAAVEASRLVRQIDGHRAAVLKLKNEYRWFILETVSELKEFRDSLEHIESNLSRLSSSLRYSRQRGYVLGAAEFLRRRLREFYTTMGTFLQSCHANETRTYLEYFRHQFRDFLWQPDHVSHWNSGLPPTSRGTYGSMGLVLQGEWEGTDLFSKALGVYNSILLGDEALRHRTEYMTQKVMERVSTEKEKATGTRVLSVASGINSELREILQARREKNASPLHLTAMDSEMNFLLHTQLATRDLGKKQQLAGGSLNFEHWALKENLERYLKETPSFDVIYSTYLLDCLSEEELLIYLVPLWESLAPEGTLILANVGKEFHSPVAMELEINWNAYARTTADLANLGISVTGETQSIKIESDEESINLFLILKKLPAERA